MRRLVFLAVGIVLSMPVPAPALISNVTSADDVCPPTADPCVINQTVKVESGSVLDFGSRTVRIEGNGLLNTGSGIVTVYCGEFIVDVDANQAIKAKALSGGQFEGGLVEIEARRRCSLASDRSCISDFQCRLGTCSASVCSGDLAVACSIDAECDFGACGTNGRCSGAPARQCSTDSDCQAGACSVSVCSSDHSVACATDGDCQLGACTVGSGIVDLNGIILADGATAGSVAIRGAGNVAIRQLIKLTGNVSDADGGSIDLESGTGSLIIQGELRLIGGGLGGGGDASLTAGLDVVIDQAVDATGGDFDGGSIDVDAGRDVIINAPLLADSVNGAGFGGDTAVAAGRDVIVSSTARIGADGHFSSIDVFGGDGGSIELSAGRNVQVDAGSQIHADGAKPDGFGGDVTCDGGNDVAMAGEVSVKTNGPQGGAGSVSVIAGRDAIVASTGVVNALGAGGGGGDISVEAAGRVVMNGRLDGSTGAQNSAATVSLLADGNTQIGGTVMIDGVGGMSLAGAVDVDGCDVTIADGGILQNAASGGKTTITSHHQATIASGAQVSASGAGGTNEIVYRDPALPPSIQGTVTPAATTTLNPGLISCDVCGDSVVGLLESCDDGNTADGDGCSAECQDEGCTAQTPGWPSVPLCDDGLLCTTNTCTNGSCQAAALCDDGNSCTDDTCTGDGCLYTNNTGVCDDGLSCTAGDTCSGGLCVGTTTCAPGTFCSPFLDQCVAGASTSTTSTTTTSTTTTTVAGGLCGNGLVEGAEQCDDGDTLWVAGEFCSASCVMLACGDPDDSGAVTASDALFVLRSAVRLASCDSCLCDVDDGGSITASDALRLLRKAVGQTVSLACPACF